MKVILRKTLFVPALLAIVVTSVLAESKAAPAAPRPAPKWVALPTPPPPRAALKVLLPAARDANALGGLPLRKLLDASVRDPQITRGGDGYFYMVGTEMDKNTLPAEVAPNNQKVEGWIENNGIPLWRSKDLQTWETLGYAWTFERDATWQKGAVDPNNGKFLRSIWAPEIHFIKGNYWIAYSVNTRAPDGNYVGTGILRSTTGKAEGPYVDVKPDGPLTRDIDASLFEDDDGKVYFLFQGYQIARMNDDMTGLAEPPRKVEIKGGKYIWAEGVSLIKQNGKYILGHASVPFNNDPRLPVTYDYFSSAADSIYGPYEPMRRALPHCGHNHFFKDREGNWWSSYFGTDPFAPFHIRPGLVAVEIDKEGRVSAKHSTPRPVWRYVEERNPVGDWKALDYDDSKWSKGPAAFGEPEIAEWGPVTYPATSWRGRVLFLRQTFQLEKEVASPSLYLRYSGLNIRIWINGKEVYAGQQPPNDYITVPLPTTTLNAGRNVIAAECMNAAANRYFDVGLVAPAALASPPTFEYMEGQTQARREIRDPCIIREGDTYYLTFTMYPFRNREEKHLQEPNQGGSPGIALYSSRDLKSWTFENWLVKSADLPENCPYKNRFWAPEIHKIAGKFYLIFTADNWIKNEYNSAGRWGTAGWAFVGVADKITGPYEKITWLRGAGCDTTLFGDTDGKVYAFIPRGNIDVQEVDVKEMKLVGQPRCIVTADNTDIGVAAKPEYLEGPWVEKIGKKYCLFYAEIYRDKNFPDWLGYWTGVAYADHPLGPWKKDKRGKIFLGGHAAVFDGIDNRKWFSYRGESNDAAHGKLCITPVNVEQP